MSAKTVSISSRLASDKTSSSKPFPLIMIVLFNSLAINSARVLSFSIILIRADSNDFSIFFAKLNPIFPPPIIKILLDIFSL